MVHCQARAVAAFFDTNGYMPLARAARLGVPDPHCEAVLLGETDWLRDRVTLRTDGGATVRAKVDVDAPAARGDQVGLRFDAAAVSLFDEASGRTVRQARFALQKMS